MAIAAGAMGERETMAEDGGGGGGSREGHVIRWESFLPRRSLRVLLVESDDSTRHVVNALLRKCNYSVAGVADGMKAWDVMMEKRYYFDLVLTEVAMPSHSGIELLSKIVSTEECKNILLSSNSYMNATDNNTASNQISANIGGRSKTEENSDERSDAQSSSSKQDIEIESILNHEEPRQVEDRCIIEADANLDPSHKDTTITIRASVSKMDGSGNPKDYKHVGIGVNVTLPIKKASLADLSGEPNRPCDTSLYREENFDLVRSTEENNDDPNSYC